MQLVEHWWVVGLQAFPVGQSSAPLHPQVPATHAVPVAVLQLVQAPPLAPQVDGSLPSTHVDVVLSQQPPLHAMVALHVPEQVCLTGSHACTDGQSAEALHPQAPFTQ